MRQANYDTIENGLPESLAPALAVIRADPLAVDLDPRKWAERWRREWAEK